MSLMNDPTMSDEWTEEDGDIGFDPLAPDEDAPYGYTIDRKTGERRAKKLPGRPGKAEVTAPQPAASRGQPSLDEIKAAKTQREDDAPPLKPKRTRKPKEKAPVRDVPFKAGVIAKGMNRMYLRAGKILRVWDDEIGNAVIECTRKETADDVTVGEAWEELAKTNPRVRAFLMKMLVGGAYGQLFMAHMPIFLAIIMKDSIRRHIPFGDLIGASLSDDEPGHPSQISEMLGGITEDDVAQMMPLVQQFMPMFTGNSMPRQPVVPVEPEAA